MVVWELCVFGGICVFVFWFGCIYVVGVVCMFWVLWELLDVGCDGWLVGCWCVLGVGCLLLL